jgi:UDP-N-acetylglucosamine 2-epimerase (non-hydrolysing)
MKKAKSVDLIVGTRPEAIKMAPLVQRLKSVADSSGLRVRLISTGQHQELLHSALDAFGLVADHDLGALKVGQSLASLTSMILQKLDALYAVGQPDLVLVHGDTTTAFSTGLVSLYRQIPFAHVEAGLRSHDLRSPFPEEFNRRALAQVASHHFAPTALEQQNLLREGVSADKISIVGNTIADALGEMLERLKKQGRLSGVEERESKEVVVTLHRREGSGRGALRELRAFSIDAGDSVRVRFPLHPNPFVREEALRELSGLPNVQLLEPLNYPDFIALLARASLVVTDSGGVQEEAALLGKPTLIVRDRTERADGLAGEGGTLVAPEGLSQRMMKMATILSRDGSRVLSAGLAPGRSGASARIAEIVRGRLLA